MPTVSVTLSPSYDIYTICQLLSNYVQFKKEIYLKQNNKSDGDFYSPGY